MSQNNCATAAKLKKRFFSQASKKAPPAGLDPRRFEGVSTHLLDLPTRFATVAIPFDILDVIELAYPR